MPPEYQNAAYAGIAICSVMIIFNLLMAKRRGWSAVCLAGAFAAMGGLLTAWVNQLPDLILISLGICVLILLIADALLRLKKKHSGEPQP